MQSERNMGTTKTRKARLSHDLIVQTALAFIDENVTERVLGIVPLEEVCGGFVGLNIERLICGDVDAREVRTFVDALGQLNQAVAAQVERVTLMVAGYPLVVKGQA